MQSHGTTVILYLPADLLHIHVWALSLPRPSLHAAVFCLTQSAQPTIGNSSTPRVQAASGYLDPTLANAFAPIGSGDNLLEFRVRRC